MQKTVSVTYVIYAATIWSVERDREGWRPYRGLGGSSDTVMHYDHAHIGVHGSAGLARDQAGGLGATR